MGHSMLSCCVAGPFVVNVCRREDSEDFEGMGDVYRSVTECCDCRRRVTGTLGSNELTDDLGDCLNPRSSRVRLDDAEWKTGTDIGWPVWLDEFTYVGPS
jgi:hypothetical protein